MKKLIVLRPQLNIAGKTQAEIENIKAQKSRRAGALQAFATQRFFISAKYLWKGLIGGAIVLPLAFVLSACTGREPNDEAYIAAMGIDKSEKSSYSITIQFARPSNISGGSNEESGEGKNIVENIKLEAPDIYSAVNMANHMISKKLSLSHMKLIVFSKEVAAEGINDIMESLTISDEVRPNLITAVSVSSANEYLENTKPIVELNPTKYYYLIYERNNSSGIPTVNAINVMSDLVSGGRDIIMPLAGVSEGSKNEDGGNNKEGFEYNTRDYKAGEVNIIEESKSEALGMAVFNGDKFAADFGKTEADLYNILSGNYENNYVSMYYPNGGEKSITIKLSEVKKPRYKIDIKNKRLYIKASMSGEYSSVPKGSMPDDKEFEKTVSEEISSRCREFIIMMRDEYNADILGVSKKAKKYFLDMNGYNDYDFREKFKDYDIEVETKFKVKHSGVLKE